MLNSIDLGAYYSFSELTQKPGSVFVPLQLGWWLGGYVGVAVLAIGTSLLLVRQRRASAAILALAAIVLVSFGVEIVHNIVPVQRPANAARLVVSAQMTRSFPSREVLTFALAATLLVFAAWSSVRG